MILQDPRDRKTRGELHKRKITMKAILVIRKKAVEFSVLKENESFKDFGGSGSENNGTVIGRLETFSCLWSRLHQGILLRSLGF